MAKAEQYFLSSLLNLCKAKKSFGVSN